jgi:Family of unknown function (DUF5320)
MPGGNGTGPAGMGPMTGRAAGYCAGYPVPGFQNPVYGGGFGGGWGRGGGQGRRNRFYATGLTGWQRGNMTWPVYPPVTSYAPAYNAPITMTKEQQVDMLKGQSEYFEDALDGIRKRIEELESKET